MKFGGAVSALAVALFLSLALPLDRWLGGFRPDLVLAIIVVAAATMDFDLLVLPVSFTGLIQDVFQPGWFGASGCALVVVAAVVGVLTRSFNTGAVWNRIGLLACAYLLAALLFNALAAGHLVIDRLNGVLPTVLVGLAVWSLWPVARGRREEAW